MKIQQVISSSSTEVLFAGVPVGYMQNLTMQADYGMQRIKNLYQEDMQSFVMGISQYTVTADRAFVELDTVFGPLDDILGIFSSAADMANQVTKGSDLGTIVSNILNDAKKIGASITSLFGDTTGVASSIKQSVNPTVEKYLSGRINSYIQGGPNLDVLRDLFGKIEWEIRIQNPAMRVSGSTAEGALGQIGRLAEVVTQNPSSDLMILKGCKLAARTFTINASNIALMENLTIYARQLQEGTSLRSRAVGNELNTQTITPF